MLEIDGVLGELPEFKKWRDTKLPVACEILKSIWDGFKEQKRKPRWTVHDSGDIVIRCCVKGKYYDIFTVDSEIIYSAVPYKNERFYLKAEDFCSMYYTMHNISQGVYPITPEQQDYIVTLLEKIHGQEEYYRTEDYTHMLETYLSKVNSNNVVRVIENLKECICESKPTKPQVAYTESLLEIVRSMGIQNQLPTNLDYSTKEGIKIAIPTIKSLIDREKRVRKFKQTNKQEN